MKHLLMILVLFNLSAHAVTLKIATVAPEGTTWGNSLRDMADEVKKKTGGKVKLKIFYGGVKGDEPAMIRLINVGQLHGGVFTGRGLGDINGDFRAIETPFTFYGDRKKAWSTLEKASSFFNKGFDKAGYVNLAYFELGLVYVVSTKKVTNLNELKALKIWHWDGDKVAGALVDVMGIGSVPLALPDVLTSLTTGVINAAYSPPMGILALQWQSKIKYIIDFPVTYSAGAMLLSKKGWKKVPKEHHATVRKIVQDNIDKVNKKTAQENKEALATLEASGVERLSFPNEDIKKSKLIRKKVVAKLKGKVYSAEAFNAVGI